MINITFKIWSKTSRLRLQNISKFEIIVGTVDRTDRKLLLITVTLYLEFMSKTLALMIKTNKDINSLRINVNVVVNSVCLPKIDSEPIHLEVVLSGWGRVDLDRGFTNKAVMKLYSIQKCRINWFNIRLRK